MHSGAWWCPISDFKAILAIAVAIVPGFFGEKIYRLLVGVRWGESQLESVTRIISFTLVGLGLHALATLYGAPEPTYAFPSLVFAITPKTLPAIAVAYGGHCFCGGLSGALAAGLVMVLARFPRVVRFRVGGITL